MHPAKLLIHLMCYTLIYLGYNFLLFKYFLNAPISAWLYTMGLTILEIGLILYLMYSRQKDKKEKYTSFILLLYIPISICIAFNVIEFLNIMTIAYPYIDWIFYTLISISIYSLLSTSHLAITLFKWCQNNNHEPEEILYNQQLKREAELYKLRQQVDPHFLFNALNSIHALTLMDQNKAHNMIYSLSQYFRNSIQKQDQNFIKIREEVKDIQLYLSIELVRFGHRLQVTEQIDDTILDYPIPPLLLQPLIENAIKYGIYGTSHQVNIELSILPHTDAHGNEYIQCVVTNPFDPQTFIKPGTGFGINGIMRRLYLTYGRNDLMIIDKKQDNNQHLFIVTLLIPINPTHPTI